jgi:predicted secreted protein
VSARVPPHYTAFRVLLLSTACAALVIGVWWLLHDPAILGLLGL